MNPSSLAAVLDTVVKLFAVIGGVSVVLSPLALAYLKLRVHDAVGTAPAVLALGARTTAVETWQSDHAESVNLVPRLAGTLERLEGTLDTLTRVIMERGLGARV